MRRRRGLADIYLSLHAFTEHTGSNLRFYTKTELTGIDHFISPLPDAYFVVESPKSEDKRYFLEIIEDRPSKALRRRVQQYFDYYRCDEWQISTGKEFPEIILVCPNNRIKGHLFFYIRRKLQEGPEAVFLLTTWELVKGNGIYKEELEKVQAEP